MKNIFKLLLIIFMFGGFLLTSCTKDANLPGPEMTPATTFVIVANAASDGSVNLYNFASLNLSFNVGHIEGDYTSVSLMYSLNNNFANQYEVTSLTSFPTDVNIGIADLITASNGVFADSTDIAAGTVFTFYINYVANGVTYYGYHPETNALTQSPAQSNIPGFNFNVNIIAAYPYIPAFFEGLYDCYEAGAVGCGCTYASTVSIDPARPDDGLICTEIWWGSDAFPCAAKIYVDLGTFATGGDDQIIWGGNAYGAYGRIGLSDFTPGLLNTANLSFWFSATPDLPDSGYWWGGPATWDMTPAAAPVAGKSTLITERTNNPYIVKR